MQLNTTQILRLFADFSNCWSSFTFSENSRQVGLSLKKVRFSLVLPSIDFFYFASS